jgi:hypothetical protein
MGEWTIFSNHGHVLVSLANNNEARLRDVAAEVGITERAVQNILRELQGSGLVQVTKHGRCNHYQINTRKSLRHPLESHVTVGKLLELLRPDSPAVSKVEDVEEARTNRKPAGRTPPAQPHAESPAVRPLAEPPPKPAKLTPTKPEPTKPEPQKTGPVREKKAGESGKATADSTQGPDQSSTSEKPGGSSKPDKPDTPQGSLF